MKKNEDEWILISGANGLVGRSVCRLLAAKGHSVIALVRPDDIRQPVEKILYRQVDLSTPFLKTLDIPGSLKTVIHLAQAQGWHEFPENAGQISRVNIGATIELAELAVREGAKSFIFTSSGGIFGAHKEPITEESVRRSSSDIGFYLDTKYHAEKLLEFFSNSTTIHIIRPFFIYGAEQSKHFLVARLIEAVRNGSPINAAGGTGPHLNPIHVDDAAYAICAAIDQHSSLTCNIAGPESVCIADLALMIGELLNKSVQIEHSGVVHGNFVADITEMSRMLHRPRIGLREGLKKAIGTRSPGSDRGI